MQVVRKVAKLNTNSSVNILMTRARRMDQTPCWAKYSRSDVGTSSSSVVLFFPPLPNHWSAPLTSGLIVALAVGSRSRRPSMIKASGPSSSSSSSRKGSSLERLYWASRSCGRVLLCRTPSYTDMDTSPSATGSRRESTLEDIILTVISTTADQHRVDARRSSCIEWSTGKTRSEP
ncbi:hypothetical protein KC345_g229 [Hortaea werneckii]|nr:hypothetical protein KC345_g229 [Hortaea werneckii]